MQSAYIRLIVTYLLRYLKKVRVEVHPLDWCTKVWVHLWNDLVKQSGALKEGKGFAEDGKDESLSEE